VIADLHRNQGGRGGREGGVESAKQDLARVKLELQRNLA